MSFLIFSIVCYLESLDWRNNFFNSSPMYLMEKEMATHSSVLAWRVPWTEELGGLHSMGYKESDTTERLHFTSLHFTMYLMELFWIYLALLAFHSKQKKWQGGNFSTLPENILSWIIQFIKYIFHFQCNHKW